MDDKKEYKFEATKYYVTEYIQKSKTMLFPIVSKEKQPGLITCYLFSEEFDENIYDYYLIAEMSKGSILNGHLEKCLYTTYETEDGNDLYIFDISDVSEDVDRFLLGDYSDYSKESKANMLKYYSWTRMVGGNKVIFSVKEIKDNLPKTNLHIYVFLYPSDFKQELAEELVKNYKLYDNMEDALRVLKQMKELCPKFDEKRETLTKKLKKHE